MGSEMCIRDRFGISLKELTEIPQGTIAVGAIPYEDPKRPVALMFMADAGENIGKLTDLLVKGTKQAEAQGSKISTESFQGGDDPHHPDPRAEGGAEGSRPVQARLLDRREEFRLHQHRGRRPQGSSLERRGA